MFYPGWENGSFCKYTFGICSSIQHAQAVAPSDYISADKAKIINTRPQNSAATMQLIHYGELVHTDIFHRYDWGGDKDNEAHYGVAQPPKIDLRKISPTLPITFFVGK